ncbi:MAG: 6-hydroxymethylpterin diphosphokinase MptE-like protein [Candidatus Brocadiia bacterium]
MGQTRFQELQSRIAQIGLEHHGETIIENSRRNAQSVRQTIRESARDERPCLIVSAGPSLYRENILPRISGFNGTIVATDGAYIQCIRAGITPDWVITIDPHPTRIVRWFGDPHFEENSRHDDYFARQDLDVDFRENSARQNAANIEAVDAHPCNLAIATSAPANVVARTSAFARYWFAPLVDSPVVGSITRQICERTGCPAINTGGTVGTAAYCFARHLGAQNIAVVGMDFGYYAGTPLDQTQEWNMLKAEPDVHDFYPVRNGHWGAGYTSPTYAWYMQNFLDLLDGERVVNCSGGGLLQGPGVECMEVEEWLDGLGN